MYIDWPREFDQQVDRMEADETARGKRVLQILTYLLRRLEKLDGEPREETATLKKVRQSRIHQLWRVSHPYVDGIALRLICWFPPRNESVVVALFAGEKAGMGDVFYDSVGIRADRMIELWQAESEDER